MANYYLSVEKNLLVILLFCGLGKYPGMQPYDSLTNNAIWKDSTVTILKDWCISYNHIPFIFHFLT